MSDEEPYAVLHLDELEEIPGPGSLTWRPVRARFDIRAFGTNAYTAARAGDDVVEPHDENDEVGHQELYFVACGRAEFRLGGETFDAPAGTYVFVRDPRVHRHAVAREPGTTVLSFGGPPTFTPSGWEWSFRARAMLPQDVDGARRVVEDGLASRPPSPSLSYALACVEAAAGDREAALRALADAIEQAPELRAFAREDREYLGRLQDEPDFERLTR